MFLRAVTLLLFVAALGLPALAGETKGRRDVSFPVSTDFGDGAYVEPGDRIDVALLYWARGWLDDTTFLSGVRVVRIEEGLDSRRLTVTVNADPWQAKKLKAAEAAEPAALIMVNFDDDRWPPRCSFHGVIFPGCPADRR